MYIIYANCLQNYFKNYSNYYYNCKASQQLK